jgi:hypothetical protein
MSVQNESLDLKPVERKPEAPELEYKAASQDSLSMFFAAIGGAVLGTLGTLLILALINGGTLNFTRPERLAVLEENLARVDQNVGMVSQNVDAVAQDLTQMGAGLTTARTQVDEARAAIEEQGGDVAAIESAVGTLQVTGQRFDTFVMALGEALDSVDRVGAANVAASSPLVVSDAAVPAGDVAVLLYADANANGALDDTEANLVGLQVAVTDATGKEVGNYVSTDAGILVEGLAPGTYTFAVTDAAGHTLASSDQAVVIVAPDAAEGQIVFFPAAE